MGQFSVGQVVTCIPMISRFAAPGDYKIVGEMPDRDGDRMYRIKSPLEEYERVVEPAHQITRPFTGRGSGAEFATRIDNAAKAENCPADRTGR
jgi:hypothetical protein